MITMKIEGGDQLVAALNALSTRVSRRLLREALLAVAEPWAEQIGGNARREPGKPDVADNIQYGPTRVGEMGDVSVGIGVPKGFFYDWFLEYGTVDTSAYPMYRPTYDSQKDRAIAQLGQAIWTELAGQGVSRPTVFAPVGPLT